MLNDMQCSPLALRADDRGGGGLLAAAAPLAPAPAASLCTASGNGSKNDNTEHSLAHMHRDAATRVQ